MTADRTPMERANAAMMNADVDVVRACVSALLADEEAMVEAVRVAIREPCANEHTLNRDASPAQGTERMWITCADKVLAETVFDTSSRRDITTEIEWWVRKTKDAHRDDVIPECAVAAIVALLGEPPTNLSEGRPPRDEG